jgi:hypothetical protein
MQVSSNITDVPRGVSETGSASSQVLSAAQSLSGESNRLKPEVGKFLDTVRAAYRPRAPIPGRIRGAQAGAVSGPVSGK